MRSELVVLFARGSGHAELLGRQAAWIGLPENDVLVLHAKDRRTPGSRRYLVERMRRRGRGLLICIDMLAEGTDLKEAKTLIVTRWTTSERLYWQIVGRGLRGPASGGTTDVTIRLYDLEFVHRMGDEDEAIAVLERASKVLLDEFDGAGLTVSKHNLSVPGARGSVSASANGTSRSNGNGAAAALGPRGRWGLMTDDSIERLQELEAGEYVYWIETAKTKVLRTARIGCNTPTTRSAGA